MSVADAVVVASTSVAAGESLTIQPGTGIEWIIHNIYIPSSVTVEMYVTDGENPILVDSNTGGWLGFFFHLTNAQYMTIKNTSASTAYFKYDGIISKST
jgi:hypothetical protein